MTTVILTPPNVLGFKRPLTQPIEEYLKVTNNGPVPIAFKVKTTAPKRYCVKPNSGIIEPNVSIDVQVVFQPFKEEPALDTKCKDKFMVQTAPIEESWRGYSMMELWGIVEAEYRSIIGQKKIKCTFLPPDHSIPEEEPFETTPFVVPEKQQLPKEETDMYSVTSKQQHLSATSLTASLPAIIDAAKRATEKSRESMHSQRSMASHLEDDDDQVDPMLASVRDSPPTLSTDAIPPPVPPPASASFMPELPPSTTSLNSDRLSGPRLDAYHSHLQQQLTDARAAADRLEQTNQQQQAQCNTLEEQHRALEAQIAQQTTQITQLITAKEQATEHHDRLTKEKTQLTAGMDQLSLGMDQLTKKNNQLMKDTELLVQENDQLIIDKDQLLKDKAQLMIEKDQLLKDKTQLANENGQLMIEKDQLLKDKTKIANDSDQLLKDKAQLDQLIIEKDQLVKDKAHLAKENERLQSEHDQLTADRLIKDRSTQASDPPSPYHHHQATLAMQNSAALTNINVPMEGYPPQVLMTVSGLVFLLTYLFF
ncbi:hypothetical protein DM01DRAFT_1318936 [Hesseltinella vesiculosa]|uniref:MSP domain-containing protein n=1 Tax=Hesseltinella vesiculosa TaxID=101127 RepID=A0A1X2GP17_9FUNG|nr:hypothetical protein DM01DRAFT_1318936 [Hesseltinella vesiculosa]